MPTLPRWRTRSCARTFPCPDLGGRRSQAWMPTEQVPGHGCRVGGRGGAKGREAGRGYGAPPIPCRAGKLRVKIFFATPRRRKTACDHRLEHDALQQSRAWQGTGREARKLSDRRLASPSDCWYINALIDNCVRSSIWCGISRWEEGDRVARTARGEQELCTISRTAGEEGTRPAGTGGLRASPAQHDVEDRGVAVFDGPHSPARTTCS
jgi:hypothetical protein